MPVPLERSRSRYELGFLSMKTREVRGVAPQWIHRRTVTRQLPTAPAWPDCGQPSVAHHFERQRRSTARLARTQGWAGRYINWQNY